MDEQLVLTVQPLRLSPDIQRSDTPGEVFVIKNIPERKYLTVSVDQWNLLRNFSQPATVPDVLRTVILNRGCLPLREFYELVLKAHRQGILQVARQPDSKVVARRWWFSLSPIIPIVLTVLSIAAAVYLLATRPFPAPTWTLSHAAEGLIAGWVLLGAGLSLGQALAACVLKWGGGEIYEPRFRLFRPVPYFGVNLSDACVASRLTQAGIWCARLFPVVATAAALWFFKPAWGLTHVLGLIVMLRPFGGGCVVELISTACRGLVLDTQKNFLFTLNKRWRVRLRLGLSRLSPLYLATRLAWGAIWVCFVIFVGLRAANQNLQDFLENTSYWREVGEVFGILAGAILIAYFGVPFVRWFWIRNLTNFRKMSRGWRRWRVSAAKPPAEEQISRVLSESLLFRRLSVAERGAIREGSTIRVFKSRSLLRDFTDPVSEVGVIISGQADLYRQNVAGRRERAMTLIEGDVFGVQAFFDAQRPEERARARTPVVALMIPAPKFQQLVLHVLGNQVVSDLTLKVPFLRGISFCRNWHPQAIARFANLSSVVTFQENQVIVSQKQDTQQFYIVYEGQVAVKRGNRLRARLRPGAYFGEVSILQNSSALMDIVSRQPSRCLLISKSDFLRFVTHNPFVSLQLEKISSKRLGRPIFPLKGVSFEVR